MRRHSTGITIALTAVFAVGLSLAPVPDAWRPIPALGKDRSFTAIAAAFLPSRSAPATQDALVGAPQVAQTLPADEMGEEALAELLAKEDAEDRADATARIVPPPAATLGAAEAGEVRRMERLMKKIGARHVDLEQGCRQKAEDGSCAVKALDPIFDALEALRRGERKLPVRMVHLGDSQIASDHITDVIRRRMELRHGSSGPGFLFIDRPTKFAGRKVRTGEATEGWEITKLTDKKRPGLLGFSGVRFTAKDAQRTRFNVKSAREAEVAFVSNPQGGRVRVLADDKPLAEIQTNASSDELGFERVSLPEGTVHLTLETTGGEVELFGVALERPGPGVVYDSVGLPGALYEVYLRAPEKAFTTQLSRRAPSLVVMMLGGNEAYEIGRGWQNLDDVRKNVTRFLARLKATAPQSACLMISPMDAGRRTIGGEIEPRPNTEEVGQVIRELALENGCGFWDLYAAMGGRGSAARWFESKMFNSDLVHPLPRGADLLGHLFDFAFERARVERQSTAGAGLLELPGLVDPSGKALVRTMGRLNALAADPKSGRFNIVQLGASHTASHMFTDVVRSELGETFGVAGRGFIAAGRPSSRLTPTRVKRSLDGAWEIPDAREQPPGQRWGLTGARAEGQAGARMSIAFGAGEDGGTGVGTLSLFYEDSPAMGRMVVRIDGEQVASLPEVDGTIRVIRATSSGGKAKVVTFPVIGLSHTVEVENAGPGPIVVFGAALEQTKGGLVYDALGLPGSTAQLADGYDSAAFVEQLRARQADLYVLFYGTNEAELPSIDPAELRATHQSLLGKLRAASPEAECLIIGPTDRLERADDGSWKDAPSLERVLQTLRDIADEERCAFWSARAAMGGARAMSRWQSLTPPLALEDGIHLTPKGYETLAKAFVDDVLSAWRSARARAEAR